MRVCCCTPRIDMPFSTVFLDSGGGGGPAPIQREPWDHGWHVSCDGYSTPCSSAHYARHTNSMHYALLSHDYSNLMPSSLSATPTVAKSLITRSACHSSLRPLCARWSSQECLRWAFPSSQALFSRPSASTEGTCCSDPKRWLVC